jgi:hypothetical protein
MISAGALAAFTVIAAGLARFPVAPDDTPVASNDALAGTSGARAKAKSKAKVRQERPVRYVRLKPGQKAPRGAKVIQEAAPTPRIVVQRSAPTVRRSSPVRVVTRTRQSG